MAARRRPCRRPGCGLVADSSRARLGASGHERRIAPVAASPRVRVRTGAAREGRAPSGGLIVPSNDVSTSAESPAPSAAAESVVDSTSEEPRSPASTTNRLLGTLVALASICICVLAEPVIMPVLVAILIGLVLAPAVRMLERWRIPRAIGALLAILFAVAIVGAVFAALATPAREWMDRAPRAMQRIEMTLKELRRPLQAATKATRGLDSLASIDEPARAQVRVVDTSPSLLAHAVRAAPGLVVGFIVTTVLAFVFLLHGDDLLRKFVTLAPHLRAKREIVLATRQAQHDLSLYMITITLINAGLGLATALALYLLGIPDPLLWGGRRGAELRTVRRPPRHIARARGCRLRGVHFTALRPRASRRVRVAPSRGRPDRDTASRRPAPRARSGHGAAGIARAWLGVGRGGTADRGTADELREADRGADSGRSRACRTAVTLTRRGSLPRHVPRSRTCRTETGSRKTRRRSRRRESPLPALGCPQGE